MVSESEQLLGSPESNENQLLARVNDLHLHFDTERGTVKALDGVNFDIYQNEMVALVGETGCGKSITARSFIQLVPTPPGFYPSGSIEMRSERVCSNCGGEGCQECHETGNGFDDLLKLSGEELRQYRGKRIAMIFQDPKTALNPSLTIKEQLSESILSHHADEVLEAVDIDITELDPGSKQLLRNELSTNRSRLLSILSSIPPVRERKKAVRKEIRDRIVRTLQQMQLPSPKDVLDNYPHELSGGQQQRVMIAMALVARPDLIIADEATTALDVTTQSRILELIEDLQDEYDTSLLYITHDLNLVREIADKVAIMYAGSIAEIGDVTRVYEDSLHPYTEGLINSIPSEERVGKRLQGIDGSIPDLTDPPEGCRFCTRCPEVMDHCSGTEPPLIERSDGRSVACHLYDEEGRPDDIKEDSIDDDEYAKADRNTGQ